MPDNHDNDDADTTNADADTKEVRAPLAVRGDLEEALTGFRAGVGHGLVGGVNGGRHVILVIDAESEPLKRLFLAMTPEYAKELGERLLYEGRLLLGEVDDA